ncbi:MAG: class I SAM-dependent methyltransferase [Candidatus Aenigmarchaeota archaeon]|nr:class I SAM-dependent methyltransferase [Candidatus Aenigmarchaeota archaeon]
MSQREVWDAIAPQWHRWREKPLPEVMRFIEGAAGYLDIGCGSRRHLAKGKKVTGLDFSVEMLKLAKKFSEDNGIDADFIMADACEMPLKDESFSMAVAAAVLHAVPKESHEKFLKEMKRVMKKGGKCIITVWNKDQEKFTGLAKERYVPWKDEGEALMRHYYLFDKEEFETLLGKSGFRTDRVYLDAEGWNIIAEISKP